MRKNVLGVLLAGTIGPALIMGRGAASFGTTRSSVLQQTQESTLASDEASTSTTDAADLTSHTLMICCDVGMTKPFQEVADNLKSATSCEMNVTYASTGQIQPQITTSEKGDMFIIGSVGGLKPVESYVSESKALVKHILILAIQGGNPKNITSLFGPAAEDMSLIIGDADSTPTGEITKKVLSDTDILDKVRITASTATAPQMVTAIAVGEAGVATIRKEGYDTEDVEIVDNSGLEDYVKTIPAASLTCSADHDARQAFLDYLNSGETREIQTMYGCEIAG